MPNPLISVILPCYNAERFLPEALESIMNQTYRNLEILCINDGSTDSTPTILESYAQKDNRIQVIHNETNLKLIRTLNKGIDLAKGEYIARMDADDVALPKRIEKQVEYLQENDVDVVSAFADFISEQGKVSKGMRTAYTKYPYTYFYTFFINPFIHPTILAKGPVLKENKYSTEPHALHNEDYELWTRILRQGYKIEILPEVLLLYRYNSQSVSSQNVQLQLNNFQNNLGTHVKRTLNLNLKSEFCSVITYNSTENIDKLPRKEINQQISQIVFKFSEKFDAEKPILKKIANRHKARINLFLLRNSQNNPKKVLILINVLSRLFYHFNARKKF